MHIVETYAANCGLKIAKPHIYEQYFPLPFEKYITFFTDVKYPSRTYDCWKEVIDLIAPALEKENIKIVQLGSNEGEQHYQPCYNTINQAKVSQQAYIIKNSLLHISNDNYTVDIASGFGRKIISIYSNINPNNTRPYWSKKKDAIIIEPPHKMERPSYAHQEFPKTINSIMPDQIARAVYKLLDLKYEYPYEYLSFGQFYNQAHLNLIPNSLITQYPINAPVTHLRMDLEFDEETMVKNLSTGRKFNIVTKTPVQKSILQHFKQNIQQFIYIIDKNEQDYPNFIEALQQSGIDYVLLTYMDEEEINKRKLPYMDFNPIIEQKYPTKKSAEKYNKLDGELFYKSTKIYLSKGKIYNTRAHWKEDLPLDALDAKARPIIDSPEFWEDVENLCILRKSA